jgi:hypothetical protein
MNKQLLLGSAVGLSLAGIAFVLAEGLLPNSFHLAYVWCYEHRGILWGLVVIPVLLVGGWLRRDEQTHSGAPKDTGSKR